MPVIFLPYKKKPWICKFREPWSGRPRVRSFNSEQEALDFEKVQRLIFEREKALVRRARYKGRQPEKTLTVAELLSAYIEARQSLSTRTTAMQHLRSFMDIYGHRKAHCISVDDVLAWMEIMRQRGAGAATVSRRAAILKGAWAWACRSSHLDSNALSVLRIPTVRSQRIDPPTLQEARRLYAVAAEHVQRVIALGMGMGPRIGPSELFRLRWLDVDLDSRLIRMPNARKGAEFEARSIPVRDDLLPLLRRWQQASADPGTTPCAEPGSADAFAPMICAMPSPPTPWITVLTASALPRSWGTRTKACCCKSISIRCCASAAGPSTRGRGCA